MDQPDTASGLISDPSPAPATPSTAAASPPSRPRLWLRGAVLVMLTDLVVHSGAGTIANDWEGWGVFWDNVAYVAITGLVLVALTFGVLVRWALRPSRRNRNRAALASTFAGVASIGAYLGYFIWAPLVVASAALMLAHAGLRDARQRGGRGYAVVGGLLGALSLGYWIFCIASVLVTNAWPLPFQRA